jgi:hypothetical protein
MLYIVPPRKTNENFKHFESHSIFMCYMNVESVQKCLGSSIPWNTELEVSVPK